MARLQRVCPMDIPVHVVQRGNNRQLCFRDSEDFSAYASWLKAYARQYRVQIHAWVFMNNHVHLLCTPKTEGAVSVLMQAIGRQYVRYFNVKYNRTGTLWEGRFKSCLIDSEAYLFSVYRYIELNPVRAGMVDHPSDYHWSSYSVNVGNTASNLCTPHALYDALGEDLESRKLAYSGLFNGTLTQTEIDLIRAATKSGMVVGDSLFAEGLSHQLNRRMIPMNPGPYGMRQEGEK
ncbi:MAG: transposase [Gammaproteobacteria bacterium]|nr:transposase [Gammaproteobacteria bacterium]